MEFPKVLTLLEPLEVECGSDNFSIINGCLMFRGLLESGIFSRDSIGNATSNAYSEKEALDVLRDEGESILVFICRDAESLGSALQNELISKNVTVLPCVWPNRKAIFSGRTICFQPEE